MRAGARRRRHDVSPLSWHVDQRALPAYVEDRCFCASSRLLSSGPSASANCFNAALALLWPLWLYGYFPLSVSLKPPTAF